jgi:anti-sigma regulatory factor (Ser/Thr protein kinase)
VALGATEDTLDAIAIAVSEAASNAVLHAYAGISDGQIEFEMSAFDQQLEIVIRDGGAGIGYAQSPGGLGQGLLIIDELADTFRVTSAKGTGTTVTMRFQLP